MTTKTVTVTIFWFRRDLRIEDNHGFYQALKSGYKVLPLFIFDTDILDDLAKDDARVSFIHACLASINEKIKPFNSTIHIECGKTIEVWEKLIGKFNIDAVVTNRSYEPYDIIRDNAISNFLSTKGISFHSYKDHVIFESRAILKKDGNPYTIYTPYSKVWLEKFESQFIEEYPSQLQLNQLVKTGLNEIPRLETLGFTKSNIAISPYAINSKLIRAYEKERNTPSSNGTSMLGVHLRFGTISIREVIRTVGISQTTFIKELIWREFFMQILANFKYVVNQSFKKRYDNIQWENNNEYFEKWCKGETGYPIVDAGIKQLNATGFMHNRVRMIVASFLCKHLLIDWRWGEAYFAEKLLDYELASNNGNWQWAAGCGCDSAPYFRIFNPTLQQEKFDPNYEYIKKWVPSYGTEHYPHPIVDHKEAREKVLRVYKNALK